MTEFSRSNGSVNLKRVLFVGTGYLGRSPIAEAVFKYLLEKKGLCNWYAERTTLETVFDPQNPPHPRAVEVMDKHGLKYTPTANLFESKKYFEYDFMLCSFESIVAQLKVWKPKDAKVEIFKLDSFDPNPEPFGDDGYSGYEIWYKICLRSCEAFLEKYNSNGLPQATE